jgi:3-oxoacyl-[acyl-carrier protein] reductase
VSVAVVTGAGGAIGSATAVALAGGGHSIVAVDVDGSAAETTAADVDGRWFECDVSDRDAVIAAAQEIGPVEILVNVAGITRPGALLTSSLDDVLAVLGVNLLGTLWCTQAFGPGMAGAGGSIVNVSSGAAKLHMPFLGIYPASKCAIEALTVQLAVEMGPLGVRVNAVAPGTVLTPAVDAMLSEADKDARRRDLPVGRLGAPEDIAAAIVYLTSPAASFVSGQVLYVDGGLTAGRSRRD